MKAVTVFLLIFCVSLALAGPNWQPASINLRRVLGAFNLVSREYEGRLFPYSLRRGYSKDITSPYHLRGYNIKIVFYARDRFGNNLRCVANVNQRDFPWFIWYLRCWRRSY